MLEVFVQVGSCFWCARDAPTSSE